MLATPGRPLPPGPRLPRLLLPPPTAPAGHGAVTGPQMARRACVSAVWRGVAAGANTAGGLHVYSFLAVLGLKSKTKVTGNLGPGEAPFCLVNSHLLLVSM